MGGGGAAGGHYYSTTMLEGWLDMMPMSHNLIPHSHRNIKIVFFCVFFLTLVAQTDNRLSQAGLLHNI